MLQCVAVCCSVLQCVAVCCSELTDAYDMGYSYVPYISECQTATHTATQLQWNVVARYLHSVLQGVAGCCKVLLCVTVCYCVLLCVAVCCSVLQCVAVCCSVLQCVELCDSVLQCVAMS